ncbi:MAG: sigma-54 dependent transcriptional regulator [Cytophagales bacterium]|nr:sigma-54 dependent transcriptional regulator [Cytophagales bacterium]
MPNNGKKYSILYIDDEPSNLKAFRATFKWDYTIHLCPSGHQAIPLLQKEEVDLIIADQRMPGMTGFDFFKTIIKDHPDPIRIILTGYSDMELLIKAINECGIYQYLTKPWNEKEMKYVLDKAFEIYQLRKDNKALIEDLKKANEKLQEQNYYLKEEIRLDHDFNNIITQSSKFKHTLRKVEKVANAKTSVLITGESGTGKELLARAIHNISNRSHQPMIKVNCAALPSELIESELFGHEKGAFTGGISARKGRFELAHKGTLFLDEIGEMPIDLQAKLLRVIQEGEFERLGSESTTQVDIRLIAATNRKLEEAIEKGEFREDLFYRLNVFPIQIPPLRERKEDIPLLVKFFLQKYEPIVGRKIENVSTSVIEKLMKYHWPGNIRELENVIERSMIISPGNALQISDWMDSNTPIKGKKILSLEEAERQHIIQALETTHWKVSGKNGAAELLNVNAKTLFSKMEKLNIKRETNF